MGLFDFLKRPPPADPAVQAAAEEQRAAAERRQADIAAAIGANRVPTGVRERLEAQRDGRMPWVATLTPAELLITRSHGVRPIAAVSATCWLHYGYSWTRGHAEGWGVAMRRLREEAKAAGANAVLDVKMRTLRQLVSNSMDFTLIGTAVRIDGLPPSDDPVVATVPALEFVKLLEADVVPTGIAVGAYYERVNSGSMNQGWLNNIESAQFSNLWERVRRSAHADLRHSAEAQGNGVLAHVDFSQMLELEDSNDKVTGYLARHIVVGTTVDARRGVPIPHDIRMVVDMHAGKTPLSGTARHHSAYGSNEREGAI